MTQVGPTEFTAQLVRLEVDSGRLLHSDHDRLLLYVDIVS